MKKRTKKKGFTLIELIVVIAILGILAAVLVPRFTGFQDRATRTQVVTDGRQIETALESLISDETIKATDVFTTVTLATDKVVALSGVPASRIKTLDYSGTGYFKLTSETTNKAGVQYTASKVDSNTAVVVSP